MRELELKAPVDDWSACVARLERAGAHRTLSGRLLDVRFEPAENALSARGETLRLRAFHGKGAHAELTWKGITEMHEGMKSREEITTPVGDERAAREILERLGFAPAMVVDRQIEQFEVAGATVRLERYPVMDDLVEVEGEPDAIERAIEILALPRHTFVAWSLAEFVSRFEMRTGVRAVLGDAVGVG